MPNTLDIENSCLALFITIYFFQSHRQYIIFMAKEKPIETKKAEVKAIKRLKKEDKKPTQKSVKRGRPKKNPNESEFDCQKILLEDEIQFCTLDYLNARGMKKGLVFKDTDRRILREEQRQSESGDGLRKIEWDLRHQWIPEEEEEKARPIVENLLGPQLDAKMQGRMVKKLIDICCIFPREVTDEFYRILCHLYRLSQVPERREQNVKSYAQQVNESKEYCFVTLRFSKHFGKDSGGQKQLEDYFLQICSLMQKLLLEQDLTLSPQGSCDHPDPMQS